jgi:hypothetical protein
MWSKIQKHFNTIKCLDNTDRLWNLHTKGLKQVQYFQEVEEKDEYTECKDTESQWRNSNLRKENMQKTNYHEEAK